MKNSPSMDEMVFEKRNRSYGAYVIRKEYPTALVASFVFMILVMTLLFGTSPYVVNVFRNIFGSKTVKVIYVVEPPEDMVKDFPKKQADAKADAAKGLQRK